MGLSSSDTAARGVCGHTSISIGDGGFAGGDFGSPVVRRGVAGVAWIAMYWFVPTTRNEHVQLRMCMYEHRCGHAMHLNNYSICTKKQHICEQVMTRLRLNMAGVDFAAARLCPLGTACAM